MTLFERTMWIICAGLVAGILVFGSATYVLREVRRLECVEARP